MRSTSCAGWTASSRQRARAMTSTTRANEPRRSNTSTKPGKSFSAALLIEPAVLLQQALQFLVIDRDHFRTVHAGHRLGRDERVDDALLHRLHGREEQRVQ